MLGIVWTKGQDIRVTNIFRDSQTDNTKDMTDKNV